MRQVRVRILGTALAMLVLIASAYGNSSVDFLPGNNPQPGEQNLLFNSLMVGHTIVAHTNRSHTPVDDMSVGTVLVGKGGQSDIDAASGLIHDITITAPGHDFRDYIFNAFNPALPNNILVNVFLSDGTEVTDLFNNRKHGENFLTVVATGPALISKITITSSGGIEDLRQNRISGVSGVVPEPSSLLLVGSGLLAFAPKLCRKKLS